MSSSEDEVVGPVKKIQRRHHPVRNPLKMQKVNLYSHKVMPKLDAIAKSPVKFNRDEDEGNDCVPFEIAEDEKVEEKSPPATPEKNEIIDLCYDSPVLDNSPTKIVPPTPPPAFVPSKRKRGRKQAKLLKEVTSVLSRVSSDDAKNESIHISDEENNIREILVKVRLKGRLNRFPVVENETLEMVFKKLSQKFRVDSSRLLITLGDRRVFPGDTPAGIELSIADIMECVITHSRLAPHIKDTVNIQMQGALRKKVSFTMGKSESFAEVMQEYANKCKVDLEDLQFKFDGENVSPTCTPKSRDMDNDDCIDVIQLTKR